MRKEGTFTSLKCTGRVLHFTWKILFCMASGNYCDIYMIQHTVYKTIRIQLGQLWAKIEEKGEWLNITLKKELVVLTSST